MENQLKLLAKTSKENVIQATTNKNENVSESIAESIAEDSNVDNNDNLSKTITENEECLLIQILPKRMDLIN